MRNIGEPSTLQEPARLGGSAAKTTYIASKVSPLQYSREVILIVSQSDKDSDVREDAMFVLLS